MTDSLGEKLRRAREEKGLEIGEIGDKTRISPHILRAIEENDFSVLPGGGYSRGFIRAFANAVGIDPTEALGEFERATASSARLHTDIGGKNKSRLRRLVMVVLILSPLLGSGIYFFKAYLLTEPASETITIDPSSDLDSEANLPRDDNQGKIVENAEVTPTEEESGGGSTKSNEAAEPTSVQPRRSISIEPSPSPELAAPAGGANGTEKPSSDKPVSDRR